MSMFQKSVWLVLAVLLIETTSVRAGGWLFRDDPEKTGFESGYYKPDYPTTCVIVF